MVPFEYWTNPLEFPVAFDVMTDDVARVTEERSQGEPNASRVARVHQECLPCHFNIGRNCTLPVHSPRSTLSHFCMAAPPALRESTCTARAQKCSVRSV